MSASNDGTGFGFSPPGESRKAIKELIEWLQGENEALKAELALAKELLEAWRDAVNIPRTNCSCHISAPCNDCYEWGALRETAAVTKRLLERK